jgi:DNA ligase (NAD+)
MTDFLDDLFGDSSKSEIDDLAEKIRRAKTAYYNGTPTMSDAAFDALEDELRRLAPNHPAIKSVGAALPASTAFEKATHAIPMGSQAKVNTEDELRAWAPDKEGRYLISEKLDGISVEAIYKGGYFKQAITRGDGETGEDITPNVVQMIGVVDFIPNFEGSLQGEIVMTHDAWNAHFPDYANPRNGASGVARRSSGYGAEHLTAKWFSVVSDNLSFEDKSGEFLFLERHTKSVPEWTIAVGLDEVMAIYQSYIDSKRQDLNYDIDGLIVQINDNAIYADMGESDNRPEGSRAFKFPHEAKEATLEDIEWQVGRTGRVTPVAVFSPVHLVGATVTHASLHTANNIRELGLRDGSTVLVSRRNDVIPYVEEVIRAGDNDLVEIPTECPCCGSEISEEGEFLYCRNYDCSANQVGRILKWINGLGVLDWGSSVVEALIDAGMVDTVADLYRLEEDALSALDMAGRRVGSSAGTMLTNLHEVSPIPLHVVIGSLGIPYCARSVCAGITSAGYDTVDKVAELDQKTVAKLPKMGATKATNFVEGVASNLELLRELDGLGVISPPIEGPLKGKTACFTGFRDADLTRDFESAGGTMKSGVSKGLNYLVCKNPNSNSGKMQKARQYGTEVLSIEDFTALLD